VNRCKDLTGSFAVLTFGLAVPFLCLKCSFKRQRFFLVVTRETAC